MLVAEVSSFQLALTKDFHPRVAVLLNVTPDHIDWHGSYERYAADKAKVFDNLGPDDLAVIDLDDPGAAAYIPVVAAKGSRVVRVSLKDSGVESRLDEGVLRSSQTTIPTRSSQKTSCLYAGLTTSAMHSPRLPLLMQWVLVPKRCARDCVPSLQSSTALSLAEWLRVPMVQRQQGDQPRRREQGTCFVSRAPRRAAAGWPQQGE